MKLSDRVGHTRDFIFRRITVEKISTVLQYYIVIDLIVR